MVGEEEEGGGSDLFLRHRKKETEPTKQHLSLFLSFLSLTLSSISHSLFLIIFVCFSLFFSPSISDFLFLTYLSSSLFSLSLSPSISHSLFLSYLCLFFFFSSLNIFLSFLSLSLSLSYISLSVFLFPFLKYLCEIETICKLC